jgi:myosin V
MVGFVSLLGSDVNSRSRPQITTKGQEQQNHHQAANNSNNRVWIKQTAIDESRKKQKQQISQQQQQQTQLQATKKTTIPDVTESTSNSSSTATPPARNYKKATSSISTPTTAPISIESSHSGSNQSSISSSGSNFGERSPFVRKSLSLASRFQNPNAALILHAPLLTVCSSTTAQETDLSSVCTENSNQSSRQSALWSWKEGYLVENSGGHVLVKLSTSPGASTDSSVTVRLSADAITVGDVVLCNEYPIDPEFGTPQVPNDLITLTHLHEPAVIESLQLRYSNDQIYTNTGPVLLALNPFQSLRGLYGESIQKKYWERAERNKNEELPPHVYAIADESFRCMVRSLEDTSRSKTANQSILVSGESGSGKTVTTKFVMKYLAALSHRLTIIQQTNDKRAYIKAREPSITPISTQSTSKFLSGSGNKSKSLYEGTYGSDNHKSKGARCSGGLVPSINELTAGCDVIGDSIEAQVLQSNPILESFGNARTLRNDNSSRFGKFIEIQFSQSGKLVGAQIETYLLEKVRLISQTMGERNYHIFYELLSGAIDKREIGQYLLSSTNSPDDFKITACSQTVDRRDGVSDRETFQLLRQAMKTMHFAVEDIENVFKVTAAILHASNLTFIDVPGSNGEECQLDRSKKHFDSVCQLLGVSFETLNKALCTFTIQAGKSAIITRSLNKEKAATGLEALLKETYAALFLYLVRFVNGSIAYKEMKMEDGSSLEKTESTKSETAGQTPLASSHNKPAASVGVLDIFGFESFTTNSFEQLCINYCNEALQQQFNAFVLRNEQAEYESEGIEWSFIEFPENQDVLDLIDSTTGILRILDDQCRAPGPSDKAFAVNVYQQCSTLPRFIASRKQQAALMFSVHHYAGPVEYTCDRFTEKNRDELPKESIDLLLQSELPFVRGLAKLMSENAETPSSGSAAATPSKARLHRLDSSVGRATVGGQFRRQLRSLRCKIDLTTPHYVRCLKPNDHLVPDHFDTAIVADQLRCGGILEAVRVARAGFTQHYPHADFVRRYRSLAWKDLLIGQSSTWNGVAPKTPVGSTIGNTRNFRNSKRHSTGSFQSPPPSYVPGKVTTSGTMFANKKKIKPKATQEEMSPAEAKTVCQDLVKILYRKLQQQQQDDAEVHISVNTNTNTSDAWLVNNEMPLPLSATSASSPKIYLAPTWSLKSPNLHKPPLKTSLTAASNTKNTSTVRVSSPSAASTSNVEIARGHFSGRGCVIDTKSIPTTWKKRVSTISASDYGKVGIQIGKTKVFLRHSAFEALERIRSTEQNKAATKLNALFRRYFARMAYIPYRDAFRQELQERRRMFEQVFEQKENIDDDDYGDVGSGKVTSRRHVSLDGVMGSGPNSGTAFTFFSNNTFYPENSLVDKWFETQIHDALRNPIPRHQWGKIAPSGELSFRWIISDEGLWIKNYSVTDSDTTNVDPDKQ